MRQCALDRNTVRATLASRCHELRARLARDAHQRGLEREVRIDWPDRAERLA